MHIIWAFYKNDTSFGFGYVQVCKRQFEWIGNQNSLYLLKHNICKYTFENAEKNWFETGTL